MVSKALRLMQTNNTEFLLKNPSREKAICMNKKRTNIHIDKPAVSRV